MKKLLFLLLSFFLFSYGSIAENDCFPKKPEPARFVNNLSGTLTDTEVNELENILSNFEHSTSTQIVVILINDLCGYHESQYAYEIGQRWGVGQKNKNNGVVILVKPTGGAGEKAVFISVGYGLEPVIPDAIAKRIVENEMIPNFKNGNIYQGIFNATEKIMGLASKEFTADQYYKKDYSPILFPLIPILFFILIFVLRTRRYSKRNNIPFWIAWSLINASRKSHRGSWGSFSSGGGSFSSGGSSFGGGSFGGGGAGGRW